MPLFLRFFYSVLLKDWVVLFFYKQMLEESKNGWKLICIIIFDARGKKTSKSGNVELNRTSINWIFHGNIYFIPRWFSLQVYITDFPCRREDVKTYKKEQKKFHLGSISIKGKTLSSINPCSEVKEMKCLFLKE